MGGLLEGLIGGTEEGEGYKYFSFRFLFLVKFCFSVSAAGFVLNKLNIKRINFVHLEFCLDTINIIYVVNTTYLEWF